MTHLLSQRVLAQSENAVEVRNSNNPVFHPNHDPVLRIFSPGRLFFAPFGQCFSVLYPESGPFSIFNFLVRIHASDGRCVNASHPLRSSPASGVPGGAPRPSSHTDAPGLNPVETHFSSLYNHPTLTRVFVNVVQLLLGRWRFREQSSPSRSAVRRAPPRNTSPPASA